MVQVVGNRGRWGGVEGALGTLGEGGELELQYDWLEML